MSFWELIISYATQSVASGPPSAKFCPPCLKPLVTPLRTTEHSLHQARSHGGAFGGSAPQISFVLPKFCYAQKNLF